MNNNLTERTQAEQKLQNEKHKFSIISENAPFGLVMVDKDGTFTHINPKFKEMFGYDLHDIPDGRTWFRKAYPDPDYRHEVISTWIDDSQKAKPGEHRPRVFTVTCKDGSRKVVNFIPVALENGENIISFEDITERTRAVESLKESEKRLFDIFDYLPDPTFVINRQGVVIAWNKTMEELTGVKGKDMVGKGNYEYGVPFYGKKRPIMIDLALSPEDDTIEQRYPLMKKEKDTLYTEIFIPTFGEYGAWLWAKAKPLYDRYGNVVGAIETIRDVTDNKRMIEALQTERKKFQILSESAPFGLVLFDRNGRFKYINSKFTELFGYDLSDVLNGKSWFRKGYPDREYREIVILEWAHFVDTAKIGEQYPKVFRTTCKDGTEKIVSFTPVKLVTGEFLMTCEDITERTRLEEELKTLSLIDELTGLYNRRGFFALGEQQLKIADRMKKDVLLIFTDLDRLKWINDNLGHEEGDRALVAASNILKETFRESDIIARIGGDEFVVLAMEAIEDISQFITSRLQDNFDQYNTGAKLDYTLSTSIGMVRYNPENPVSLDTLIALADKLMYEDKKRKKGNYAER
ncbi:MAG: PAS domain S-box protein [Proteobacteria bacterium]|nr:PAS domain S-box protein [Pseudomonadota bacterium]